MPQILNKTIHSFSSEDPNFPAANLLENRKTQKWKCKEVGEKSCNVVLKLDKPRIIAGIDIGNECSGFIEVLVANSKQDPPDYKEILLATSFMTVTEAKNITNPNRVRFFSNDSLIESVAKQPWDLVKFVCSQPFNPRLKYGLAFVTLHTPEEDETEKSPVKVASKPKIEDSDEKKKKFGKFFIKNSSDSDSDDKKNKSSSFDRWKTSKSSGSPDKIKSTGSSEKTSKSTGSPEKPKSTESPDKSKSTKSSEKSKTPASFSIKEAIKQKMEANRKRIRVMTDSSDEEVVKKPKPSRNRQAGLLYEDEDDEPNEKLQKKIDRDREKENEAKPKEKPKIQLKPEKTPDKSKFASFVSDDPVTSTPAPSTSSSRSSSKPNFSSDNKKSPAKANPEKQEVSKKISYKPFNKLLEGVVFVFSGYVNPERGILRQKALDMGAKYKPDWNDSCTHLICAFTNTPKYQQVKGQAKIVTKKWIEACFSEQKRLPWRRFALASSDKDEPESEDEIHNILTIKGSPERKTSESGSDDDMMVVDRRVKPNETQKSPAKTSSQTIEVIKSPEKSSGAGNVMDLTTDDENSSVDLTNVENRVYIDKVFYLDSELSTTDVLKLKNQITSMSGKITTNLPKAHYIISSTGKNISEGLKGEIVKSLWVFECHEMEALIPTKRYKLK